MTVPSLLRPGSKIAVVGEAPGKDEVYLGRPFVGMAGQELSKMFNEAGLDLDQCSLLNVFSERPEGNRIENFCGKKKECGDGYNFPPLRQGKYFLPKHINHNLPRLKSELENLNPNLVLALGNTACWALLGYSGISNIRGTLSPASLARGIKVLPTFHPSAVLRQWEHRPIVLADLIKAKREQDHPEIRRPERTIWIDPTLEDLDEFYNLHIRQALSISIDIETGHGLIKCVGIATDRATAIVVPFIDIRSPSYSYWPSPSLERSAWEWLRKVLLEPREQVFQNGMYDIQWLWTKIGLALGGTFHDTMLMHHALQPELPKSLGFLGSIYTNEASWKLLRHRAARTETTKRDE